MTYEEFLKSKEIKYDSCGIELKPSYFQQAVRNCAGVTETEQLALW
jgi:hypothetical protein